MNPIIAPTLFGIDPDEIWHYTPEAFAALPEGKRPVFHLKAPDAALDQLMEDEQQKIFADARKAIGADKVAEMRALGKIEDKTDEQKRRSEELDAAWMEAFIDAAQKTDRLALQRRVLGFCVAGWTGFATARGKAIAFPSEPSKVIDCMSKELRADIFAAIKRGVELTDEEKESLT